MLCIIDSVTDPYWNLAAEEYLLMKFSEPVFRLWRNRLAVIIGKHQNAMAEINQAYVREHGIPVVRRISGGGAVFHDMGNILFTFADRRIKGEDTGEMFRRFTAPIIDALRNIGVEAVLEGRNDLLIDGRKFSGNAVAYHGDRILQHGTLLFSSSMEDLSSALNSRPEKFAGKAVQSMRSRVTNISEHLKEPMDIESFMNYLKDSIGKDCTMYSFSDREVREITELRDSKYATDEWNYGHSPKCSFSNVKKFPAGLVELFLDIEGGRIAGIKIRGDYFFVEDTEGFESMFIGIPYTAEAVHERMQAADVNSYFSGISAEDLESMFF